MPGALGDVLDAIQAGLSQLPPAAYVVGLLFGPTAAWIGYRLYTALNENTLKSIARTTGGAYHPASDASELDGVASTIDLRLTVANRQIPLAGAFIALALVLLVAGAVLTIFRSGRVI